MFKCHITLFHKRKTKSKWCLLHSQSSLQNSIFRWNLHVTSHIYIPVLKEKVLKYQVTFGNLIEKKILIEKYVNLNDLNMFCVDKSNLYILIMDWEHDNIYLISTCLHCTTASQYFPLLYFFDLYTLLLGIVLDQIFLPLKSIY
jgi:hypothetical protein